MNATYEGFIKFVKDKPASSDIDHSFGWSNCAVGDYIDEVETELNNLQFIDSCEGFANEIECNSLVLYSRLVNGKDATYGSLQQYIKERIPC